MNKELVLKSREISRSKTGPFSLACTDPYTGIVWENHSKGPQVGWRIRNLLGRSRNWKQDYFLCLK